MTVQETGRYAESLNDSVRMVSAFAGVVGDAEGNKDIVVRGNSPIGILWRRVEIPNPNHEGSTGGSSEYGNALSWVFDTKFRTGTTRKVSARFL